MAWGEGGHWETSSSVNSSQSDTATLLDGSFWSTNVARGVEVLDGAVELSVDIPHASATTSRRPPGTTQRHTYTLPHCRNAALPHYCTTALPHYHTTKLPHDNTTTLLPHYCTTTPLR